MLIYCGIVSYNPDIEKLQANINAIKDQVELVVVVDNGSINNSDVKKVVEDYNNTYYISNGENRGIAKALNQIMDYSKKKGAEWVLLLDQDSVAPTQLIEKFIPITKFDHAAIICPRVYDINSHRAGNYQNKIDRVGICITSGSLNKIEVWEKIGKFDEELFIDSVDNEYCIRLFVSGFNIYRNNEVVLNHELGQTENHLFKRATNHNSFRRYYISRNSYYVSKKYYKIIKNMDVDFNESNLFLDRLIEPKRTILRQLQFVVLILLYEKDKRKKITAIFKGLIDGKKLYKKYARSVK